MKTSIYSQKKYQEIYKILELFGIGSIARFTKFESGIINESYKIYTKNKKKYVVRIYNKERKIKDILFEVSVMQKLRQAGIPIPEIFFTRKNKPFVFFENSKNQEKRIAILMEYIPGFEISPKNNKIATQAAHIHAKMHTILAQKGSLSKKRKSLESVKKWLVSEFKQASKNKNLTIKQKESLLNIYSDIVKEWKNSSKELIQVPFGFVHFDYDSSNILSNKDVILGVIDFDDVRYAPFAIDIAFSLWWWMFFNFPKKDADIANLYISSYQQIRPLTPQEVKLIPFLIRTRNLILTSLLFINMTKKPEISNINKALLLDKFLKEFQFKQYE